MGKEMNNMYTEALERYFELCSKTTVKRTQLVFYADLSDQKPYASIWIRMEFEGADSTAILLTNSDYSGSTVDEMWAVYTALIPTFDSGNQTPLPASVPSICETPVASYELIAA